MFLANAALAVYVKSTVALVSMDGGIDPYLPDGGTPKGAGPVLAIIGKVGTWILLGVAAMAMFFILITLFQVARNRARLNDVGNPLIVLLIATSFGSILGIISGAFTGIMGA